MFEAVVLGILEGLTEFLPISSTGHLLIAQHWLERRSDFFNVAIQAGAITAVSLVYRRRLEELARSWSDPVRRDYVLKLGAAFLVTSVLGLIAKLAGADLPSTVAPVAWALIIGGIVILFAEGWARRASAADLVTWPVVIAVGMAQVLAGVFPGTSRSGAAIFAAMLAGLTLRTRAVEFAFLVGIPTMFAAASYEFARTMASEQVVAAESWSELLAAFVAASVTGFFVVKWLLRFLLSNTFVSFAWYRIALGFVLLVRVN